MAVRNIVNIDEEKCDGCGLCVTACAEGAIEIIDGKAKLVSETYCDGLGACLGHCPRDAITIEKRDAAEFDEQATQAHLAAGAGPAQPDQPPAKAPAGEFVCPGAMQKALERPPTATPADASPTPSQLSHWPVQLKLVSPQAPWLENADLLLVADCVPFAMGDFHNRLLSGHSVVVGCPKLDDPPFYIERLSAIIKAASPRSLAVVHMEVPCCFGLTHIAQQAIACSEQDLTFEDITVSLQGDIIKRESHTACSTAG